MRNNELFDKIHFMTKALNKTNYQLQSASIHKCIMSQKMNL